MQTISSAVILAAGYGKRLLPLTKITPKPLIFIGLEPSLNRIFHRLQTAGISHFYLNSFHLAQKIEAAAQQLSAATTIVREPILRSSGGGVANFRNALQNKDFILHNCDIYSEEPLQTLIDFHAEQQAICTLMTVNYPLINSLHCQGGHIQKFGKPQSGNATYAGIAVFSPKIWNYMPQEQTFSLVSVWENAQKAGEKLAVYPSQKYWNDFGTHLKYWQLHQHLSQQGALQIEPTARIHNSVFQGFNFINKNCFIKNCSLKNCIVFPNTFLENETCHNAIICGNDRISY